MREYIASTIEYHCICSDAGVIEENLFTVLHGLLTIRLPASWHQEVDSRLVLNRSCTRYI